VPAAADSVSLYGRNYTLYVKSSLCYGQVNRLHLFKYLIYLDRHKHFYSHSRNCWNRLFLRPLKSRVILGRIRYSFTEKFLEYAHPQLPWFFPFCTCNSDDFVGHNYLHVERYRSYYQPETDTVQACTVRVYVEGPYPSIVQQVSNLLRHWYLHTYIQINRAVKGTVSREV
jgi:hypothetical protein